MSFTAYESTACALRYSRDFITPPAQSNLNRTLLEIIRIYSSTKFAINFFNESKASSSLFGRAISLPANLLASIYVVSILVENADSILDRCFDFHFENRIKPTLSDLENSEKNQVYGRLKAQYQPAFDKWNPQKWKKPTVYKTALLMRKTLDMLVDRFKSYST